jgi:undecaprenyl-diphosphatase
MSTTVGRTVAEDRVDVRTARRPSSPQFLGGPAVAAALGLGVLVAAGLVARTGTVGGPERSIFHAINDSPSWLYRPAWVFEQFGNLVVAFVVVAAFAVGRRSPRVAALAVAAVIAKLAAERIVKQVVERHRPAVTVAGTIRRGNVPVGGLSFVSGHAVITAAMAMILGPMLPGRWRVLPWAIVLGNGLARIFVGAHNPLDVVGGVGLGILIGGVLTVASNAVAPTA